MHSFRNYGNIQGEKAIDNLCSLIYQTYQTPLPSTYLPTYPPPPPARN